MNEFQFDFFDSKDLVDLLAEGYGQFKITKAEVKTSKTGNPMMELNMQLTDVNGKRGFCNEYLVATKDESGKKRLATKIKNLANSIGKPELYGPGRKLVPNDLLGEGGTCYIKVQSGGEFADRNVISKYIKVDEASQDFSPEQDDLPF